jgi:hypothetical protein
MSSTNISHLAHAPAARRGAAAPPLSGVDLTLLRTATQRHHGIVLTVAGTPGRPPRSPSGQRHLLARVGAPTWTGADGDVEWAITPRGQAALAAHEDRS